jgi:hypothetical protein
LSVLARGRRWGWFGRRPFLDIPGDHLASTTLGRPVPPERTHEASVVCTGVNPVGRWFIAAERFRPSGEKRKQHYG